MALSIVFNPFTGKFDYVNTASAATDSTAPYYIPAADTITIAVDKQMLFAQPCQVDGTLVVNGLAILL